VSPVSSPKAIPTYAVSVADVAFSESQHLIRLEGRRSDSPLDAGTQATAFPYSIVAVVSGSCGALLGLGLGNLLAPSVAAPLPLGSDRSSWVREELRKETNPPSMHVRLAVLVGFWEFLRILTMIYTSWSLVPYTRRSCWKPNPRASVDG
jgi:hypothetical protein